MKWLRNLFKWPAAQPAAANKPAISTKPPESRPEIDRVPAPQASDPPQVWAEAICRSQDKEQARDWLMQLKDEAGLAQVAMRARGAETRFAAVQRIATDTVLESVAQASRDKDKRVYRHCADELKRRRQAAAHARRAEEIAGELQRLLAAAPLPNTRLLELNNELAGLPDAGAAGENCQSLMQQALTQLHVESEAQRDLNANHKAAIALAAECRLAAWPWNEALQDWLNRAGNLRQAGKNLPNWLAAKSVAGHLDAVLGEIDTCLAALAQDAACMSQCEQWLAEAEAGAPADADAEAAWMALAKPENSALLAVLDARWQALKPSPPVLVEVVVEAPVEPQRDEPAKPETPAPRKPRVDLDAVRSLLDALEQAIAQGHLIDADAVAKRIKAQLAGNSLHGALESRLHGLQTELETLRGWARWGAQQAREKLIESAKALLVGENEIEALAKSITQLRDEWKRLNTQAAAPRSQWEAFDAALEQAYQPVAAFRAEQATRQAEARGVREGLCDIWEAELAGIDWSQADFKAVEARRAEIIKQWREAPQVGFRDERLLRKRFDMLIDAIDRHLEAARAAEIARRETLIAAAEALQSQDDLRQAMAAAKSLQQTWGQQERVVRLKRSVDQQQWQRFRAACNRVFERLDVQRAEQAAQRQEEQRAHEEAQQARERLERERQEKHRARFELMARKAALVERVESVAAAGSDVAPALSLARQEWDALARLPDALEQVLEQRLALAPRATRSDLDAGLVQREDLLLDLEIRLGLDSPEQYAQLRRQRQLSRLQSRFGAASESPREVEAMLVRCYATAASPNPVCERRLAEVARKLSQQG